MVEGWVGERISLKREEEERIEKREKRNKKKNMGQYGYFILFIYQLGEVILPNSFNSIGRVVFRAKADPLLKLGTCPPYIEERSRREESCFCVTTAIKESTGANCGVHDNGKQYDNCQVLYSILSQGKYIIDT